MIEPLILFKILLTDESKFSNDDIILYQNVSIMFPMAILIKSLDWYY